MTDKSEKDTSKLHEQPADADEIRDVMDDSTADTETADITESEAEGLMQQVQQLTEALEKEKKDYLFLRADFDNYRKRMLKEREELLRNAAEKVLKGLLPIVDDFERGLEATKNADSADAVREGMELIYNKLIKYLADNGVKPMESTGAQFDPDFHEAIATIPAPTEDLKGKVVDTTTRGYMLNDKVLRHAKVAVGE
ncbi:MAG: nucleotide exchange factor GrpE [Muribaculaceae bacterium]|nr:nucleotide exchange factor GrpE [Muribaculaceae bacterium]MCI9053592.1 nucleotide exchange factor GrpE [Muribaculaceae bacterium]